MTPSTFSGTWPFATVGSVRPSPTTGDSSRGRGARRGPDPPRPGRRSGACRREGPAVPDGHRPGPTRPRGPAVVRGSLSQHAGHPCRSNGAVPEEPRRGHSPRWSEPVRSPGQPLADLRGRSDPHQDRADTHRRRLAPVARPARTDQPGARIQPVHDEPIHDGAAAPARRGAGLSPHRARRSGDRLRTGTGRGVQPRGTHSGRSAGRSCRSGRRGPGGLGPAPADRGVPHTTVPVASGVPRYTLTAHDDRIFARLGPSDPRLGDQLSAGRPQQPRGRGQAVWCAAPRTSSCPNRARARADRRASRDRRSPTTAASTSASPRSARCSPRTSPASTPRPARRPLGPLPRRGDRRAGQHVRGWPNRRTSGTAC